MSYAECLRALESGRLISFATDTLYALACDPHNDQAVAQLRTLKRRAAEKPLPLLIAADFDWERLGCTFDELAESLAGAFWPGKLTLIVRCRGALASLVGRASDGAVGLRAPEGDWLQGLLAEWDGPLIGTSANIAGDPPARSYKEVRAYFGDEVFCIDGGATKAGLPSTVVDLVDGTIRVDREGAVSTETLNTWMAMQ